MESKQYKFDFLRAAAALVVMFAHAFTIFMSPVISRDSIANRIASVLSEHAVFVFFLLSGYLIMQSILNNMERNGQLSIAEYLTSRLTRIYPPLLGSIAVCLLCFWIIHRFSLPGGAIPYTSSGIGMPPVREYFLLSNSDVENVLLMKNGMLIANGPLWSLNIEFLDYILLLLLTLTFVGPLLIRALAVGCVVAVFFHGMDLNGQFAYFSAIFAFGSAAACAVLGKHALTLRTSGLLPVIFLVPATIVLWGVFYLGFMTLKQTIDLQLCVVYAYLFFGGNWLDHKLESRVMLDIADFSYSLYIVHFPLLLLLYSLSLQWIGSSAWRALGMFLMAPALICIFCRCFARFFENKRLFYPLFNSPFVLLRAAKQRILP